jgi:hypothetical protein
MSGFLSEHQRDVIAVVALFLTIVQTILAISAVLRSGMRQRFVRLAHSTAVERDYSRENGTKKVLGLHAYFRSVWSELVEDHVGNQLLYIFLCSEVLLLVLAGFVESKSLPTLLWKVLLTICQVLQGLSVLWVMSLVEAGLDKARCEPLSLFTSVVLGTLFSPPLLVWLYFRLAVDRISASWATRLFMDQLPGAAVVGAFAVFGATLHGVIRATNR